MRAFAAVVCVLVAGVALADNKVKTPNLIGKTLDEANKLMKAAGFIAEAEDHQIYCGDNTPQVDDGLIRCQDPDPGTPRDKYQLVMVDVVHGGHKKGFIVASQIRPLIGKPIAMAKDALKKAGFVGTYDMKEADGEHHIDGCDDGAVCWIEPMDNIDVHGKISMYIVKPD